ncbi:ABC transporter permease [Ferrimicrobium acidiphilum]|uniref:ABC transporter permease n=1 Tax=Ferrimicrobium acidiphilum TaxID=121039 RepID=UPI0023F12291|nr:ABC transporter permease [Ferrimicrobium acidiphilum]
MIRYILRRCGQAIITIIAVSIIVFIILHLLPGGLVRAQLGQKASPIQVHALEVQEGLLKPLPVQYLTWAWNALRGNLGYSYKLSENVSTLLSEYVPRTFLLVAVSLLFAVAIAIPMGLWQGYRRNHLDDHALSGTMLVMYSMPTFLLGVVLIVVLNIWLPILPSTASNFGGSLSIDATDLALPIITLSLANVSYFSRYMRSSVIDNLLEDYVRTAKSKGARNRTVLLRHVLRNSLNSTLTLLGLSLPYTVSGSLIVEALFNYPGAGLLFWNSAQTRDFPVLLGIVLIIAVMTVLGNLIVDILYGVIDPRVRVQ